MERNCGVEAWRFIGAVSIAIYHFFIMFWGENRFPLLYIWVEFFFIVSGYFLGKNGGKGNSFKYVWRQIKKLWPIYFVAFLFCFIYQHLLDASMSNWLKDLFLAKDEIFLTQAICIMGQGTRTYNFGGPAAYISVQLLATLILHCILSIDPNRKWSPGMLFCFSLLGYAYILNTHGNLSIWIVYDKFFCVGVLRGLCGMSVGILFSLMPQWSKRKNLWIQIASIMCLIALLKAQMILSYADMLLFLPVFGMLVKSASDLNLDISNRMKKFFILLGRMSMPIFMLHSAVILGMKYHLKNVISMKCSVMIFLAIVSLASILIVGMQNVIRNRELHLKVNKIQDV